MSADCRPRFAVPGSPLEGRRVPMDWKRLDAQGKRRALVAYGYAANYSQACSVMGKHMAAVGRVSRLRRLETQRRIEERAHPEGRD